MADSAFTGVGLGIQSPDVMTKLSNLLTVKSQQQALAGQAAEVAGAQQTQRQRAALAKYDFGKHIGEDGTVDLNSLTTDPDLRAAAGDQFLDVISHAATAKEQQLAAKQKLVSLRSDQRNALSDMLGPLLSDKDVAEGNDKGKQKVNDAFIQYGKLYGDDVLPVISAYAPGVQKAPPHALASGLRAIQMQAQSASQQVATQQRSDVNTGAVLKNVNPLAAADNTGDIPLSIGPSIQTDANGRSFIIDPRTNTANPVGAGSAGAPAPGAAPSQPTGPRFTQPVPGQAGIQQDVETTRKADADYGSNRHVNDTILKLSEDTATGPGTAAWHKALGRVTGLAGGNQVADYQTISAMLDRQAAMSAKQMGLPDTNAGLQTAAGLSGTTDYAPEALQTKVKLTDALVEGSHQYRQGLDKVVGTGQNQDLTRYNDFRAQWADNFDPNVFRAENAIRRGDKKELQSIKEEVGTRGMAELKQKSDNLRKLATGQLLQ
jgi:hypothetical protein